MLRDGLPTVWTEGGTLTIWKEARGVPATAVQLVAIGKGTGHGVNLNR